MSKCHEENCGGEVEISANNMIAIRAGRQPPFYGYPCDKCGRLHWSNGSGIKTNGGKSFFLVDGKVIIR